jgi:pimeloyl-ACP methyl ester carboxylesterase
MPPTLRKINSPIVFLPGTLCDERIWLLIWQQLNMQEKSYVPLQWAESKEQMLALTQDRIDQASCKVTLVGFSMGAYIAALAGLQNTKQTNNAENIKQIIMIGYNPCGLSNSEQKARNTILKTIKSKQFGGMSTSRLQQYFTQKELTENIPHGNKHKQMVQTILDMQNDLGPSVLHHQIMATTPREDISQTLAKCKIKQHFISATHDKIADIKDIKNYCENTPQADLIEIENSAHITPLSKADQLANIIASLVD